MASPPITPPLHLRQPPPPPTSDAPSPPSLTFHRLSQPFILRLPIFTTVAGMTGLLLGLRKGGEEAGLRFRAENAHRLPSTQAGWYLYHKSKNYHVALGGIYEGFRMARRLAPWAAVFVIAEEGVDRGRAAVVREWRSHRDWVEQLDDGSDAEVRLGNKDFVSTMLAGLVTAGGFAGWRRMPLPTALRLMKMGAKVGLGYGLVQDMVNLLQGRRLGYVEAIKRLTVGTSEGKFATAAG